MHGVYFYKEGEKCNSWASALGFERVTYEYPYSKYWVFLSCVFVFVSLLVSVYVFYGEPILIALFLIYTIVLASIFFLIKLRLYSKKRLESVESEFESSTISERSYVRPIYTLMAALIVALFLPFILLLFLSPMGWFLSIVGFIAGINVPEIVLYFYSTRIQQHAHDRKSESNGSLEVKA